MARAPSFTTSAEVSAGRYANGAGKSYRTTDGGATSQRTSFGNAVNKTGIVRAAKRTKVYALGVELHEHEIETQGG